MGLSPLHARVMSLFDAVNDKFHHCAMDNLYNSAAFCKAAFTHSHKVLVHGVTRKGMRGIPECVKQEEEECKKKQLKVRGTVKVAVLKGDPFCPNLIATSIYDTKPVHYLSMCTEKVEWSQVKKSVYNRESGEMESMKFLQVNQIHKYNNEMGHVDIADQLRGTYRMDHWVRNRKWWWSIMFWGIGVLLTNAYVMYVSVNTFIYGFNRNQLMSHHDFRRAIAVMWINMKEQEKDSK